MQSGLYAYYLGAQKFFPRPFESFRLKCVKPGSDYKDEIYELLARTPPKANLEIRGSVLSRART